MHAILASIGTDGDIIPYLGLGAELRRRGHRVTLAVAEPWRDRALELGLEFSSIVSTEEDRQMLESPDFWHPIKGPYIVARWGAQYIERQYNQLAELCQTPGAVLVANSGLVAARVVNEKLGIPMATLLLQPGMIKSSIAPPVMAAGMTLPRWAPRVVGNAYWWMLDVVVDLLIGRELNGLRKNLGMQPVKRIFDWWLSEQMVIGMFPEWYGPRQADWVQQVRLAGFPMFDGRAESELSEELIAFCGKGEPPIVFTFGTGMKHGHRIFAAAVEACEILGRRGILLSRHTDQLPKSLPSSILWQSFAPFQKLFPLCAAVVHHGGVGTTAKALASATPQLLMPMAYDQPDNATRVKRLGVGDYITPRRATAKGLAGSLRRLLDSGVKQHCAVAADRFGSETGLAQAANWVEKLAISHGVAAKV
jgi:rhamnosyltransferase subunit B